MKRIGLVVAALLAAILLAVTNPTMADFHNYLKAESAAHNKGQDALSNAIGALATWLETEYGKQTAIRKDYVVFSLYTAEVGGRTQRWIGFGKQFVALSE